MVRKIKILISLFIVMLVLSMDLGTLFAPGEERAIALEGHEMFEFSNIQHNVGCIAGAIKCAVVERGNTSEKKETEKKEAPSLTDQYGNALADATTKVIEDAINAKKDKEKVE